MNKLNELRLFYNDIKYVTRSLTKDSETLYCCIVANSKRHKQRTPKEIEAFMIDEEKRLDQVKQSIHKIRKIAKKGKQKFHIKEWTNFKELDDLLEKQKGMPLDLKPPAFWFDTAHYDQIQDMIDEVQTKTEDSERSKKRIYKVWSKEVFQAHNVRFTIEYVEMLGKSSKYFNTNYWKYKKHLKTLFIEEESLYSDEEIKLLKKNVATVTENDNWLFFKKRRIKEVLGDSYIGKETDFNQIRKNYDKFYSWQLSMAGSCDITPDTFVEYCNYMDGLKSTEYLEYYDMLQEFMPFYTPERVYRMPFAIMERQIGDYQNALKIIRNQYGISYLQEMKEVVTLEKWNKLIQRILEKDSWLKSRQDEIAAVFGEAYQGTSTNWEQMKECILESVELIHGIPEKRMKAYGFFVKKQEESVQNGIYVSVEEAVNSILEKETSIAVKEIVRRTSRLLGQKRVTAKLKKEVERYLTASLPEDFSLEGEFVIVNDEQRLQFYIPPDKEKREIETISSKEMKLGVKKIIQAEREITLDNLTKLIANLMGYPRRTKSIQIQVEAAVKQLKKDGKIVRKSGGWCLVEE